MNNPEAVYDTLFIGQRLQRKIEDFSQYEIQFFAYFSCLLSLYDGNTVNEWMYFFVKTELGSPYSIDINNAIQTLNANRFIKQTENSRDYFTMTEIGLEFLRFQDENAGIFSNRKKYLNTACNSISLMPFGSIKEAIRKEPVLYSAANSLTRRSLLEESNPGTKALYSQFKDLKTALEDKYHDLIVPAVVWIESLNPETKINSFMIVDQRHIDYYKKIADALYLSMVLNDYGADKQDLLIHLTDTISKIYKHLKYNSFKSVVIYTSIESTTSLSAIAGSRFITISSYDNLAPLTGDDIVIEVKANGDLNYSIEFIFDVKINREGAIIYKFLKSAETEIIFGKTGDKILPSIPDCDSYFAIQTYKDLDLALEDYSTKVARHSECGYLKDVWADSNKIFFKPKPEHILRDSLTHFLKIRLRNTEVRPEQIVDKSHPVDIKVTWSLASHLALIEIKWLGKALQTTGIKRIKKNYTEKRAINGAKQLSDYLDANLIQSPVKTTRGYLAIFDARRWGCSENTISMRRKNGLKYQNKGIVFAPNYTKRPDFAKPFRFFMEPQNMTI